MKHVLLFSLLFTSITVFAKTPASSIGAELLKGVKADVKKDDGKFRKPAASRAPASVMEVAPAPVEKTFERKTNQLGKPVW